MTDKPNDGGPAFPTVAGHTVYSHGMTLRDWFAGQALIIAYMRFEKDADPSPDDLALQAYFIAEAMIAERNEP